MPVFVKEKKKTMILDTATFSLRCLLFMGGVSSVSKFCWLVSYNGTIHPFYWWQFKIQHPLFIDVTRIWRVDDALRL